MDAYWINLDDRTDRASQCLKQLSEIGVNGNRVPAVTRREVGILENTENQNYFQGVVACRKSHMKALKSFLSDGYEFGLILEDDFLFSKKLKLSEFSNFQELMRVKNIHLLQIGFLPPGVSLPRFFSTPIRKSSLFLGSLSLANRPRDVSRRIVRGFLPGSHAYIVSRNMAVNLLENAQLDIKVPMDLWLGSLSEMNRTENTMIHRLRFSVVAQNTFFDSDLQS